MRRNNNLNPNTIVSTIIISNIDTEYFFEIETDIVTTDIAEAVAIMMYKYKSNDSVWNIKLSNNDYSTTSKNTLYWLSGGDNEWVKNKSYNVNWSDCLYDYMNEYEHIIVSIVKNSKTLGDIRKQFIKYLNLDELYNFALYKGFIKE